MNPMSVASDAKGDALALRRFAHKALEKITAGIESFRFNTSVAQIYELTNALKIRGMLVAFGRRRSMLSRALARA